MAENSEQKQALIVWGGWMGHEPDKCAAIFAPYLESQGYQVTVATTLDIYLDHDFMHALDLIVPIWTMGTITNEQESGLLSAVESGVGIAGWHGGMGDSNGWPTQAGSLIMMSTSHAPTILSSPASATSTCIPSSITCTWTPPMRCWRPPHLAVNTVRGLRAWSCLWCGNACMARVGSSTHRLVT